MLACMLACMLAGPPKQVVSLCALEIDNVVKPGPPTSGSVSRPSAPTRQLKIIQLLGYLLLDPSHSVSAQADFGDYSTANTLQTISSFL